MLKAREHVTAAQLAAELGISIRTLNRDLEILRDLGIPIDSDRGRGGGLRLQRHWALGRLHLSPVEAIDLLLSIAIAEHALHLDRLRRPEWRNDFARHRAAVSLSQPAGVIAVR